MTNGAIMMKLLDKLLLPAVMIMFLVAWFLGV